MINYKNERGSITVFVLVSCLFIIASVTCTQIYMQSKQIAIEREYSQIKFNYGSNETLDESYEDVKERAFNFIAQVVKTDFKTKEGNLVLEVTLSIKSGNETNPSVDDTTYEISLDKDFLQISDNNGISTIDEESDNDEVVLDIVFNPDKGTLEKDEVNILVKSITPYEKEILLPITEAVSQYVDLLNGLNRAEQDTEVQQNETVLE